MSEALEDSFSLMFLCITVAAGLFAVFTGHPWGAAIALGSIAADLGKRALEIKLTGYEKRVKALEEKQDAAERDAADTNSAEKMMAKDLKASLLRLEERVGQIESDKAAVAVHPNMVFR